MKAVIKDKLSINQELYDLIVNDIIPGTGIEVEGFWKSFQDILHEFMPKNKALLDIRDDFQAKIDAWHIENRDNAFDAVAYKQFLSDIGYIIVKNLSTGHVLIFAQRILILKLLRLQAHN